MPVRRTSPSTRHGEMTERPADVPLGDGDNDRDVAQPRSGWLCSRSRRQRRHVSNAGRRSRFRFVPIGSHSCLLPTTATSSSADIPWLPVSSGEPTQHTAFSWQQHPGTAVPSGQRRQHSRCEAPIRLTVSQTPRYHTQRTLSSPNSTQLHSARLFHTAAAHCKIRAFSSTVYTQLSSLAKFLRKPTKNMCFSREHTVT